MPTTTTNIYVAEVAEVVNPLAGAEGKRSANTTDRRVSGEANTKAALNLQSNDISSEKYREYEFPNGRIYRINYPQTLYQRTGGTTHRVVDADGITHCVPAPTAENGVVLRWKATPPVSF